MTVDAVDGYVPQAGDLFVMLLVNSWTGSFSDVLLPDGMSLDYGNTWCEVFI